MALQIHAQQSVRKSADLLDRVGLEVLVHDSDRQRTPGQARAQCPAGVRADDQGALLPSAGEIAYEVHDRPAQVTTDLGGELTGAQPAAAHHLGLQDLVFGISAHQRVARVGDRAIRPSELSAGAGWNTIVSLQPPTRDTHRAVPPIAGSRSTRRIEVCSPSLKPSRICR